MRLSFLSISLRTKSLGPELIILPVYSALPSARTFEAAPPGLRKVVIAMKEFTLWSTLVLFNRRFIILRQEWILLLLHPFLRLRRNREWVEQIGLDQGNATGFTLKRLTGMKCYLLPCLKFKGPT